MNDRPLFYRLLPRRCHSLLHFTSFFILPSTEIFFTYIIISACLSSIRHPPHLFRTIQPKINTHTQRNTNKQTNTYKIHVNRTERVCDCIELYAAWTKQINKTIQMMPIQTRITHTHTHSSFGMYVCVCATRTSSIAIKHNFD